MVYKNALSGSNEKVLLSIKKAKQTLFSSMSTSVPKRFTGKFKKRKNARRLHCLKELENRANYIWNFPSQGKQSKWHGHKVLRGGGRKSVEILDYERLASIIMRISISNETSKKEFWKAVAQNYFKMFTVDKKRVERLCLVQ
jgi:hypothetical protein